MANKVNSFRIVPSSRKTLWVVGYGNAGVRRLLSLPGAPPFGRVSLRRSQCIHIYQSVMYTVYNFLMQVIYRQPNTPSRGIFRRSSASGGTGRPWKTVGYVRS